MIGSSDCHAGGCWWLEQLQQLEEAPWQVLVKKVGQLAQKG
jgi:hypothetical protein